MRVVRIQEDRIVELVTHTPHKGRELLRSCKLPLSLRSADQNRHFQFTGGFEHTFQQDEIGDVEVANGDTIPSGFL